MKIPKFFLTFLTLILVLVGWVVINYVFCNFYNPFTIGNYKLYVHPNRIYKIKYPSSWMVEESENRVCLMDFNGKESEQYKFNFAENYIIIEIESSFAVKNSFYDKKITIKINNQQVEAYLSHGGGSTFSGSSVEIRIPSKLKQYPNKYFVITIGRNWYDDDLPNFNSISPESLLDKAMPIIETFEISDGKPSKS